MQKTPATVLDAVAEVFNAEPRKGQKKVQLIDEIVEEAKSLTTIANAVVSSLQGEVFPATAPLSTPQASLQTILAATAPFASDEGRVQAEAEVAATRNAVRGFTDVGTKEDDPTLKLLKAQLDKQETALLKRKKPPTAARRKTALVAALDLFFDRRKELKDSADTGEAKAVARAKDRADQLHLLHDAVGRLKDAAQEAVTELQAQHAARAQEKEDHAEQVVELISEKIDELQQAEKTETSVDLMSEDDEALTATELTRDQALRDTELTKLRLTQLQTAAGLPQQGAGAGQAAGAPPEARHRFLNCTTEVDRDHLPKPLPDVGTVTDEIKATVLAINEFYTLHQFSVLPPTSLQQLGAETETAYAMIGETIWEGFFGDQTLGAEDALPTQLHTVLAHQARLAANRFAKGAKGDKGVGKGQNGQY